VITFFAKKELKKIIEGNEEVNDGGLEVVPDEVERLETQNV
jgi:hypothetical protein